MKQIFIILLWLTIIQVGKGQTVFDIIDKYENFLDSDKKDQSWPFFDLIEEQEKSTLFSSLLEELGNISGELTDQDQINKDLLELIIKDKLFHIKWKSHEMPLSAEGGFITGIVFSFRGVEVSDSASAVKYLKKLKLLPKYVDQRIKHMRAGQKRGVSSPKLIAQLCRDMLTEFVSQSPSASFLSKPALGSAIEEEALEVVIKDGIPALEKLHTFLDKEYITNAPSDIGVNKIPTGKEFYEQRVKYYTTDNYTPEEIFEIGKKEVKRIRGEMKAIIDELEFDGTFDEFFHFLRTDEQFYAKTPEEILLKAAWITKEMEGELPKYFNLLPRMPLTVKPVPAAIAPNYTAGRYSSGSYENHRAGQYWVNTTKLESRPLYALPALSLHEGVPGHHTQIMLAAELDLPKFRKNQYLSAFGEGWALYCEYLGKEAGIYHTLYDDFGRLVYEMWRACRLVVDPGMHYKGWSREKAFQFMKDNTALSIHEINTEINRYIGWPGQAVSYKMGELKIKELRNYAEKSMGDNFNIRDFHDVILVNGSIPLKSLERVVYDYVSTAQNHNH